jgi:hypothetical protein
MPPYRIPLTCALLLGATLSTPAYAVDESSGLGCSLSATTVLGEPNVYSGVVAAGPVFVANADGAVAHITITCTVQINNATHGGGGVSGSGTQYGNVGAMSSNIAFTAGADDEVYLCTRIDWLSVKGADSRLLDEDASSAVGCGLVVVCDVVCERSPSVYADTP